MTPPEGPPSAFGDPINNAPPSPELFFSALAPPPRLSDRHAAPCPAAARALHASPPPHRAARVHSVPGPPPTTGRSAIASRLVPNRTAPLWTFHPARRVRNAAARRTNNTSARSSCPSHVTRSSDRVAHTHKQQPSTSGPSPGQCRCPQGGVKLKQPPPCCRTIAARHHRRPGTSKNTRQSTPNNALLMGKMPGP